MMESGTNAFLVIKDGELIFENYFNNYDRCSPHRFYSITKSFSSALIGIAIGENLIKGVDEPITAYIPELDERGFNNITIKNLLQMQSGIRYKEGFLPWKDDAKVYLSPDCRKLALKSKIEVNIGEYFHYNDLHPLLLAMILERNTGMPVAEYFEKKLYTPLNMEYPVFIAVDSYKSKLENMESGIIGTAIDLAKFGQLYLNNGNWNGNQLIPEEWIKESTCMPEQATPGSYFDYYNNHPWGLMWFRTGKAYYRYFWWGNKSREPVNDYFALGALGQVMYKCPEKNIIAIRFGSKWGVKDWWPSIIKNLIDNINS